MPDVESDTLGNRLPAAFIERMALIIAPRQYPGFLSSFDLQRPLALRINTLRSSKRAVLDALRSELPAVTPQPCDYLPDALLVADAYREQVLATRTYRSGLLYSQGLSSQLAPVALAAQPGEEILDLCAAPGGKTLAIANMLRRQGRIAAVEKVKARFFKLKANLAWQGNTDIQVYRKDGISLWRKVPERFDRVLLDAPCSSESRFSTRRPDSYAHWSEKKVKEMAAKQRALAYSAIQCLKPGGRLCYATCSFAPEENEAVIDWLLGKFPDRIQVEALQLPIANTQPGLVSWKKKTFDPSLANALRILPDSDMSGFFICNIRKQVNTVA